MPPAPDLSPPPSLTDLTPSVWRRVAGAAISSETAEKKTTTTTNCVLLLVLVLVLVLVVVVVVVVDRRCRCESSPRMGPGRRLGGPALARAPRGCDLRPRSTVAGRQ